jgi:four helix bundle protein
VGTVEGRIELPLGQLTLGPTSRKPQEVLNYRAARARSESHDVDLIKERNRKRSGSTALRMLSFQKLRVYQASIEFLALTLVINRALPKGNADLADQLLRSAQSQPRNIAEGAGRWTKADQARFYMHARGSAMESAATLDTMRIMDLVDEERYSKGIELLTGIVSMLTKMT